MEASVRGIYAAGDIMAQLLRQVTNGTGDCTIAAAMAQRHSKENNLLKSN